MANWKSETDVDVWVCGKLQKCGLKKNTDFNTQQGISDFLKEALKGASKTEKKTGVGKLDVTCEKYKIPVIIEDKLSLKKLVSKNKEQIKTDYKSVSGYAVNGALHYAFAIIESKKYTEAIAIGVAGDKDSNAEIQVYYVFGSTIADIKYIENCKNFNFLESKKTFNAFYNSAKLTEADKHQILIDSKEKLNKQAKLLNKLMHNLNITAPQRVLYVSGMLLAMQDIVDKNGNVQIQGLCPSDLKGLNSATARDGLKITNQIKDFLNEKTIPQTKKDLMLASFSEISKDAQRDEKMEPDKIIAKQIVGKSSANKQIFTFIYENIFKSIDAKSGHLDIMGELYSEFLKYALGDGKQLGIVLTPPYVTKMMAQILGIDADCRVMDLATGSAGFLISAMKLMIEDAENRFGENTKRANKKIEEIKKTQLLGVELNAEMYTLATTNMILRGDGSSKIEKGDTFRQPDKLYKAFAATRILLNPPFTYSENGMPFIEYGLSRMPKGGRGAIIIQDSAGSSKAAATNKQILKKNTLLASIKMPVDLFQPSAGVQTSIYVFEAGVPHDYQKTVKFIDFSTDGYKRTGRGIIETDNPTQRYADIIKIYKAGRNAQIDTAIWNLYKIYVEDFITDSGNDWNFNQHQKIDITPTEADFRKTIADYLSWKVSTLLKDEDNANFQ